MLHNPTFSTPSISGKLPRCGDVPLFSSFSLKLPENAWRQIELLPQAILPTVKKEMAEVEKILFMDDGEEITTRLIFDRRHVRDSIGETPLAIAFDDFYATVNGTSKGAVSIPWHGEDKFITNGFAVKSGGYNYYGIVENNIIKILCLTAFESMDDEMANLITTFNLLLIQWCKAQITTI